MKEIELINIAKKASENSWSPYSNLNVGSALITEDGKIYTGCNIENHGIQSICSERVALLKAISEGEKNFKAIAIVSRKKGEKEFSKILPCGYCRQFLSEFCKGDFKIYTYSDSDNKIYEYQLKDLLPYAFEL